MRRVITGLDENGKSTVLYEGPPQSVLHSTSTKVGSLTINNIPQLLDTVPDGQACVADIWETTGLPVPDSPDPMSEPRPFTIEPPGKGMRIRYQVWGPHLDSSTMHATATLDVNFIISGEVDLLLEEGRQITLRAGDALVLPAVQHGWRAGPEGVTMLNIMQKMA